MMNKGFYTLLFFLLLLDSIRGQVQDFPLDSTFFMPLEKVRNIKMEKDLKSIISANKTWAKLVRQKKMCVGVVDLSNPLNPKYSILLFLLILDM